MIIWVFGGTAVGKKNFIRVVKSNGFTFCELGPLRQLRSCWMKDEWVEASYILSKHRTKDLLIRWQWRRENVLADIVEQCPNIHQAIVFLKCDKEEQERRAFQREGELKWTKEDFRKEDRAIGWLITGISLQYELSVYHIDVSKINPEDWKVILNEERRSS